MARPRKNIDQRSFENLCKIMCTLEEISGFFDCSPDTIERWCKRTYHERFTDTYSRFSAYGKMRLRRSQFKLAEKNATMGIWLGKQYLDQRDRDITDAVEKSNGVLESILALRKNDNVEQ